VADQARSRICLAPPKIKVSTYKCCLTGIENLVIPMVENAHQAHRIASVTRYPPKGTRSVARLHRGNCYGR
jgi:4-hydroxy-2-oxoheptanedioate aldolase